MSKICANKECNIKILDVSTFCKKHSSEIKYKTCEANRCERLIRRSSTYCTMHKKRLQRHGDANFINPLHSTGDLKGRLYSKFIVDTETGCWNWQGAINKSGYGTMGATEFGTLAHRISYGVHIESPGELLVCHTCDNRKCVNPDHLFIGTTSDNNHDRDEKGRFTALPGSSNGNSKLDEDQVSEIKSLLKVGVPQVEIAKHYEISQTNISDIKLGKIWKHVK